jgi:hypothetical protein
MTTSKVASVTIDSTESKTPTKDWVLYEVLAKLPERLDEL